MSFAERLRFTRKEKGLSQEEVAEILEVSRQSVTKWETGISFPEMRTMLKLASLLERDLDWLLYDEMHDNEDIISMRQNIPARERPSIPDRCTLNSIMKKDLINEMLNVLHGYELKRDIRTDEYEGSQTVTFYRGRAFSEITTEQKGERKRTFRELSGPEIEALLLPWNEVNRTQIQDESPWGDRA